MAEVEYTGMGGRLGKAIVGIPIGIILFLVAFPLLFWNEGRAVHRAQDLEEGAASLVSIADPSKMDNATNGKLVHLSGEATTKDELKDDQFGVSATAIKLSRAVEIYQWTESSQSKTEKQIGGGEKKITTYTHKKEWSKQPVDSSGFHADEAGNIPENVGTKPYSDTAEVAKTVTVGAYKLNRSQIDRMGDGEKLPVTSQNLDALTPDLKGLFKTTPDGDFYQPIKPGGSANDPQIGDLRVSFKAVKPQPVSLIAKQNGDTFEPYPTKSGGTLDEFRLGTMSAAAMIQAAQEENTMLTWVLRLVGLVIMAVGIFMVLRPFTIFADILPIFGDLASAAIGVFALLVALPLTLITIALGWVFYRPLLGIGLLVVAFAMLGGAVYFVRKGRAARAEKKRGARADEDDYEDRPSRR